MSAAPWTRDPAEVLAFARDMTRALRLDGDEVIEVFQHPQAWEPEHAWWEAAGRPDDAETWKGATTNTVEALETDTAA